MVLEFCSRQDRDVFTDKVNQENLLTQRMQRYDFCATHVLKRVNATKQINKRSHAKREEQEGLVEFGLFFNCKTRLGKVREK